MAERLVKSWNYTRRNTDAMATRIMGTEADITIYYSYETPIGYSFSNEDVREVVVTTNYWGPTTGRHMNEIPWAGGANNYENRVPGDEFERRLNERLAEVIK